MSNVKQISNEWRCDNSKTKLKKLKKQKRIQIAEDWEESNISLIREHKYTLYKVRLELVEEDVYGNIDVEGWGQFSDYVGVPIGDVKDNAFINGRGFKRGFPYFWKNVLVSDDDFRGDAWFDGWWKYKIEKLGRNTEKEWYDVIQEWIFEHAIAPVAEELDAQEEERAEAGFSEDMSGEDYEIYCGRILQEAGWNVEQTQASNDQGVDLIAQIEDLKVCIQCKRYSNPVGNKAVQEVIAGKAFYNGTHAVVVSNAGFTKAAKNLAESADVLLISDTDLEDLETMV